MNESKANEWKSAVLDEIFAALAASNPLESALIFKGARILKLHLGSGRQSLDIDSNINESFLRQFPDREKLRGFLEEQMKNAIHRHFERKNPVRLQLKSLTVKKKPREQHPLGWDAFEVRINVVDQSLPISNLPALEIDVAAPEKLLESSVTEIEVRGHRVWAYTIERIAGEKLRAFLSTLPSHRKKSGETARSVRAKDLYDLTRISKVRSLNDTDFWRVVGQEFKIACESRYVDCYGIQTFQEDWGITQQTYEASLLPTDISFSEVEFLLKDLTRFFESEGILPFVNPRP